MLAETTAGGVLFLFLTPLWNEVRRGFFYLTGGIVLVMALATAGTAASARASSASGPARAAVILALITAGATLGWIVLALVRKAALGRAVGIATVPLSVALLFALARTGDESTLLSFFQLLAGAVFIGAVLDGLLLGHWYLTERKLPRRGFSKRRPRPASRSPAVLRRRRPGSRYIPE